MKTLLKSVSTFLMVFYGSIVVLMLVLNWKKLTVSEEISFGFSTITSSPFIIAVTLSGIIIFLIGAINYVIGLKSEVDIRKKQNELNECNARKLSEIDRANGHNYQKISQVLSDIQKQLKEMNEVKSNRF